MTHKPRLLVHTSQFPIRWGDMDALGHVNNTVYFRFMEQARIEWVDSVIGAPVALRAAPPGGSDSRSGRPFARTPAAGGAHLLPIVIVNASCTFLRPLVYPGEVEVRVLLGEAGRTSVGSYYELLCAGELHAEGAAKIVWIEPGTGRPAPLPPFVPELLREAAAGAAAHR